MTDVSDDRDALERWSGWALAAMVLVHLLALRPDVETLTIGMALLGTGAWMRYRQLFLNPWIARGALVVAAVLVGFGDADRRMQTMFGQLACVVAAALLLQRVTPGLGLRVILCLIGALTALTLLRNSGISGLWIVADVAAFTLLARQVHRPAGATVSFWASLRSSLRLVIPVAIVVTLAFRVFPRLSPAPPEFVVGLSGADIMNPGDVADLRDSRRVAFVAQFLDAVPNAPDLYWRGYVLEISEGLLWRRDPSLRPEDAPVSSPSIPQGLQWRYSQLFDAENDGIFAPLECPASIVASRVGRSINVLRLGASVFAIASSGTVRVDVESAPLRPFDPPVAEIAGGCLELPESIRGDPDLQALATRLLSSEDRLPQRLVAIGRFLRTEGFVYTGRPGRMAPADVAGFFTGRRRGFCEHYAAAVATLLRVGNIPARVVVGYRGGEWNPWSSTIMVRDSHAHAWVEAWNEPSRRWLRFDPTAYVAPELSVAIERDRNSSAWPWYRTAASFVQDQSRRAADRFGAFAEQATWVETGAAVVLALLLLTGLCAVVWKLNQRPRARNRPSGEWAARALMRLERRVAGTPDERRIGEAPLAWLARLRERSERAFDPAALARFAAAYEAAMYSSDESAAARLKADLRVPARSDGAMRSPGRE